LVSKQSLNDSVSTLPAACLFSAMNTCWLHRGQKSPTPSIAAESPVIRAGLMYACAKAGTLLQCQHYYMYSIQIHISMWMMSQELHSTGLGQGLMS